MKPIHHRRCLALEGQRQGLVEVFKGSNRVTEVSVFKGSGHFSSDFRRFARMSDSESETDATDVDAMSSSGGASTGTDIEGCETVSDIGSSSSDADASTYSACFSSSTTSDDDLPNWAAIRRQVRQLGCCTRLLSSGTSLNSPRCYFTLKLRNDPLETHKLNALQKAHVSGWGHAMLCRTGLSEVNRLGSCPKSHFT